MEFDRPVNPSVSLVKVDGYDIDGPSTSPTTLNPTSNAAGNYKYTVNVTDTVAKNTIFEKGTHEVIIYDVDDTAAAYKARASVLSGSYTITDDVSVPVVEDVIAVNANRFFLQTNVAVDLSNAKLKVEKGNHEFTLADANFLSDSISTKDTVVDAYAGTYRSKPGVWVVVTDDVDGDDENPLYKGNETSVTLKVTLENYKDAKTNSLIGEKAVKTVTLNKNNSKPVVESAQVNGDNLDITFAEVLQDANPKSTDVEVVVRNKDGVIVSSATTGKIVADANGDKKVLRIALGAAYKQADEPYSVEIKAGEIKYAEVNNLISGYLVNTLKNDKINTVVKSTSTNFLYTELTLTDVTNTTGKLAKAGDVLVKTGVNGKDTIEIYYGREMTDSARSVSNYTLDGKSLPAGTTVDFVDGKDRVRIVLPEGSLKASTSYKLGISTNVKTAENSTIVGSLQTKAPAEVVITLDDNVAPELKSAVYLRADEEVKTSTSTTYIELTFTEVVKLGDYNNLINNLVDDLNVVVAGSEVEVANIIENVDVDGNKVTDNRLIVVLATPVNVAQATTITVVDEDSQKGDKTTYIVDRAGNKAKAGSKVTTSGSKYSTQYAKAVQNSADAAAVASDKAALTVSYNGTDSSVTLPTSGANGTTISWTETADHANVATLTGNTLTIERSAADDTDDTVTLTATITKGTVSDTKDITLTVKEAKAPTVTSSLKGNGSGLTINANASVNLTFSEDLDEASKKAVEDAITTGKTGNGTLSLKWIDNKTLVISNTHATDTITLAASADITANITDLNGNTTTGAILVTK